MTALAQITDEQQAVVDAVMNHNDNRIIAVNACAGSGKTRTCNAIVNTFKPKNGFYTAFNKAIVEDSKQKFGHLISCRTLHSLAYKYVRPSKDIRDLTYKDIYVDQDIGYKIKLIETLDEFYRSKYLILDDFYEHTDHEVDLDDLLQYADLMLSNKINPTFSFLLKKLHILLADGIVHPHFDLLLLDESQDVNGVMLEIFKLLDSERKVILGDRYQNIYSFMNTINAFEELDQNDLRYYYLTQSFRCRPIIADRVERYGIRCLATNYRFRGNPDLKEEQQTTAYLSKLNSSLIFRIYHLLEENIKFSLIRPVEYIFEFPLAMYQAGHGLPVQKRKYKYLEEIYQTLPKDKHTYRDYLEYCKENEDKLDDATCNMASVMENLYDADVDIVKLKNTVSNMETNPKIKVSTIHAYKGLEADTVILDEDISACVARILKQPKFLNTSPEFIRSHLDDKDIETLNLMYVGLSRARSYLICER